MSDDLTKCLCCPCLLVIESCNVEDCKFCEGCCKDFSCEKLCSCFEECCKDFSCEKLCSCFEKCENISECCSEIVPHVFKLVDSCLENIANMFIKCGNYFSEFFSQWVVFAQLQGRGIPQTSETGLMGAYYVTGVSPGDQRQKEEEEEPNQTKENRA